jgi:hypothetical protein
MTEEEIRDVFRDLRDEPVPADSLARVRSGLEERLRRRSRWQILGLALAGVAVLMAIGLLDSLPLMRKPVAPAIASHTPVPPPIELPAVSPRAVIAPAILTTPRRREQPAPAVSIRIETPDPDVVILLVGD